MTNHNIQKPILSRGQFIREIIVMRLYKLRTSRHLLLYFLVKILGKYKSNRDEILFYIYNYFWKIINMLQYFLQLYIYYFFYNHKMFQDNLENSSIFKTNDNIRRNLRKFQVFTKVLYFLNYNEITRIVQ